MTASRRGKAHTIKGRSEVTPGLGECMADWDLLDLFDRLS